MSLRQWLNEGYLQSHTTSAQEIRELLAIADRDLTDATAAGLSADWRFNIAYNAALQLATAALAATGYRARGEGHHYRVIQSLAYTIGLSRRVIKQFDGFRKKRHVAGYERAGAVSDHEAEEMADLARRLRKDVENWLRAKHPDLL